MYGSLEDLIGEDKLKEITTDTINGIPVLENGQVVLKSKDPLDEESNIESDGFNDSDEYLSEFLQLLKTRTVIIGVGGAGNNAITRLQESGVTGAITIAVNTDAQDLYYANADQKILIGKEVTGGLGSGNNPRIGEKSAESDLERIRQITRKNIVFITCGMGGGTGTGASPIIAREAQKAGALVVSFCTLPFKMEGAEKETIANEGLLRLAKYSDTIIPLPNEKLIKLVPNLTLMKGFKIMDEILIGSVRGIVDLVSNCGLVNLDLADVKNILKRCNETSGYIGKSEINIDDIAKDGNTTSSPLIKEIIREKTLKALHNPILEMDPSEISSCLVSITGNQYLSLNQVNEIVSTVSENIQSNAKLKFGAMIDPNSEKIHINIIGQGPISPYVSNAERKHKEMIF
ncbi:MAG: cell division FtsZ family protein [Candidatus Lokiarchaeota archaeon]|nr:cell division FtsZ family protein [Candidatus Lokiarchaeota archaeon]